MRPTTFTQQNRVLIPYDNGDVQLGVWSDGEVCLSRWRLSWRERFSILFGAPVWLWVKSGGTQPPVALEVKREMFP